MRKPPFDSLISRENFKNACLTEKLALLLSSWFGIGFIPFAPGTFGAVAGLPLILLLSTLGKGARVFFLLTFILLAIWASGLTARRSKRRDPPEVVIDEVAGFLVTFSLLSPSWPALGAGFVLFRFFDILKPFPIRRLEERWGGGAGIVLDDLAAGICAHVCLRIMFIFCPWL